MSSSCRELDPVCRLFEERFGSAVFFGFDLGMHAMWAVCQGAFAFFEKMVKNKVIPKKPRWVSSLLSVQSRAFKKKGEWQWLHNLIQAKEWKVNVTDSYCEYVWSVWNGSLDRTFKVFDEMDVWTMLAWKTRIAGLALNWCGRQLLTLWWKMGSRTKQVWLPCSLFARSSPVRETDPFQDIRSL